MNLDFPRGFIHGCFILVSMTREKEGRVRVLLKLRRLIVAL